MNPKRCCPHQWPLGGNGDFVVSQHSLSGRMLYSIFCCRSTSSVVGGISTVWVVAGQGDGEDRVTDIQVSG